MISVPPIQIHTPHNIYYTNVLFFLFFVLILFLFSSCGDACHQTKENQLSINEKSKYLRVERRWQVFFFRFILHYFGAFIWMKFRQPVFFSPLNKRIKKKQHTHDWLLWRQWNGTWIENKYSNKKNKKRKPMINKRQTWIRRAFVHEIWLIIVEYYKDKNKCILRVWFMCVYEWGWEQICYRLRSQRVATFVAKFFSFDYQLEN